MERSAESDRSRRAAAVRVAGWIGAGLLIAVFAYLNLSLWPTILRKQISVLQQKQEALETEIARLRAAVGQAGKPAIAPAGESLFHIYGPDRQMRREEVIFSISLPDGMGLLDKLRVLAEKLSSFEFSGLSIEVEQIARYGGRNIAVINLRDPETGTPSWKSSYFDNKVAGYLAGACLRKTFLQEEYQGPWIDGIEVLYNSQPFYNDWPHVGLSGTILRQQKP